ERNLKITFGIQVRPNSLSEAVIDYLSDVGLKYVFMGIESDNPRDFKIWGRAFCEDTWRWVKYMQMKGIEVNAGTLMFHPDCTFEGIRNFAFNLHQHGLLNYRTAVNRLDAMPGSFFHEKYVSEHPEENSQGIVRIPFREPVIELFYETVLRVLAPIEAPSMHALCAMPIVQTRKILKNSETEYLVLKEINSNCDDRVSTCFFSLLEMFENEVFMEQEIDEMAEENTRFALKIANRLSTHGFVDSPELLLQTISFV
ncbi:MAG: hypothetical protein FWG22_06545, partial [Prolixibacteraceae bacterium]|nr:hypothetical protein [Prolixibacteraceae bacterium]